jgi:hypothetical protein
MGAELQEAVKLVKVGNELSIEAIKNPPYTYGGFLINTLNTLSSN